MKMIKIEIPINYKNIFLIQIKNKLDVLKIILEIIKLININFYYSNCKTTKNWGKILINLNKMKRIYLLFDEKKYSIVFPFIINFEKKKIYFNNLEIDSKVISDIQCVINSMDNWSNQSFEQFVELIWSIDKDYDYQDDFWLLLKSIFMIEDWYIRCDYDIEHDMWKKHPINHFDIFYSNSLTLKLWLKKKISDKEFIDILDKDKDCLFLT